MMDSQHSRLVQSSATLDKEAFESTMSYFSSYRELHRQLKNEIL